MTLNRKVLIIQNPGVIGSSNFCDGVSIDNTNYLNFFQSKLGGCWEKSEIKTLKCPTTNSLNIAMSQIDETDFSIIVFCGHGYYSTTLGSTMLELNDAETVNSSVLRCNARKRIIVLDCCRERLPEPKLESRIYTFSEEFSVLNQTLCKDIYNRKIMECSNGIVLGYACSQNETAGDSQSKGGYYSSSLLKAIHNWYTQNKFVASQGKSAVFSIVDAHNASIPLVKELSGNTQNPEIEKPRTKLFFPIAVIA